MIAGQPYQCLYAHRRMPARSDPDRTAEAADIHLPGYKEHEAGKFAAWNANGHAVTCPVAAGNPPVGKTVSMAWERREMVSRVGFEPTTIRLKVECSTD